MSKTVNTRQWLAQRPYIIALVISIMLILWMTSGVMKTQETPSNNKIKDIIIPQVKVATQYAEEISDTVELYGRTAPDRITTLKAEISGKIEEVLAQRGSIVHKGQIIARLEINDLTAQLKRSQTLLEQRKIEYKGNKKLNADGYQGEVQLSIAAANLEAVKADIKRLEINIENTVIRAPFDGILNTRYVEQGDYVKNGDDIAMIADLNPLIVRAYVTEKQIEKLKVGQKADIRLLNKAQAKGEVRYIASVADETTNTFKIEISIDNTERKLLAGLSSEVNIVLSEVSAIKISPALLALDELGNIGVKTVNEGVVNFTPINIVKSESDGIWLSGLGEQTDLIILGQGFVRAGDQVDPVMSNE